MLHLIIDGCWVADTDTGHNAQSATRHSVQCVQCVQCVHNVSKVQAVRSLDLRRICSANVNSAGHGAGVSFPVQIQPGDASHGQAGLRDWVKSTARARIYGVWVLLLL